MKTKNTPRFTAEASLYKKNKHYSVITSETEQSSGHGIVQQMRMSLDFTRVFHFGDHVSWICNYDDLTGELIYCDIVHS